MGKSYTHHDSTKAISKQPRDHFVPGKRLCSKTNPRKLQYSNAIMLSWRSRDAAPSGGGPRGGGPRGAAALMRRDGPRPSRIWHAPSAWRASCARRPLRSSSVGRARVPCAERVPCAVRATVAPAARCRSICCELPYWMPLVDAVLNVVV